MAEILIRTLLKECAEGKAPDDFLITREDGTPIRDFRKAWVSLCITAGLGKLVCKACKQTSDAARCAGGSRRVHYVGLMVHDMRRTAARNLRRSGVSERVIMRIGGWKTASIFQRFNIIDSKDMREGLQKLGQARQAEFGHKVGHNSPHSVKPICQLLRRR